SFAGGYQAVAAGESAVAVGNSANAAFENSIAIGNNAIANNSNSVALGAGSATTIGAQSGYAAYGLTGSQTSTGEVNVGSRTISGVAPGAADTDAVNVAQLKAVSDQTTAAIANATTASEGAVKYDRNADGSVNHDSVTLEGTSGTALHNVAAGVESTDAVNVGQLNDAIGQVNASVGDVVNNAVNNAVTAAVNNAVIDASDPLFSADGDRNTDAASATGTKAVAVGAQAVATGAGSIAMGSGAQATADNAMALGQNAVASGTGSVAMGNGAQASAESTTAVGQNSVASGAGGVALGNGAQATANNTVALGQNSVADRANTVSVGAAGSERQITNVAAGTQGTDAVNVNQLNQSAGSTLKSANDYTDSQTEGARRDAYAGTAAALAVAGLPQAVLPGRGMVALGGGTYGGQSAVAIGISQLSENGIWAYKVSGTTSTRGQFGVSVGAGMHW
ncbi:YadA family autotransporter adhesin, partial [Caballeronia sp. LjRoot29]|uniref:YadA family autotransporter adhesin n=1 Tax=Caballeronia sp. LjRoot29 TaxID=3342315 RepID=UPI003F503BEC